MGISWALAKYLKEKKEKKKKSSSTVKPLKGKVGILPLGLNPSEKERGSEQKRG